MTPEEKTAFVQMEKDIAALVTTQNINGHKLDVVLNLLKGDDFGNPGFVDRVKVAEADIRILKENRTINSVYIKIITWLLGIIATGVVGFLLNIILKTR